MAAKSVLSWRGACCVAVLSLMGMVIAETSLYCYMLCYPSMWGCVSGCGCAFGATAAGGTAGETATIRGADCRPITLGGVVHGAVKGRGVSCCETTLGCVTCMTVTIRGTSGVKVTVVMVDAGCEISCGGMHVVSCVKMSASWYSCSL
jgi:hypothetical protein